MLGMPWTNPLKLQVGSDEHIVDTTINRGLMMLLNNDYYLDMKTSIMANVLSSQQSEIDRIRNDFDQHSNNPILHQRINISTTNIDGTNYDYSGDVNTGSGINTNIATKNYITYLPIDRDASYLNTLIKQVPHNLNGYASVFMFVVPETMRSLSEGKNSTAYVEYSCNIQDECICFDKFYNGTVIVMGDMLHSDEFFNRYDENDADSTFFKTELQISNPVRYDSFNVTKFLTQFKEAYENGEEVEKLKLYETNSKKEENSFNKIQLVGTALNERYSLMSFLDSDAEFYVKNLKFKNSLNASEKNIIYTKDMLNFDYRNSPTKEKLLLTYPLQNSNDEYPVLYSSFMNMLNENINDNALEMTSKTIEGTNALLSGVSSCIVNYTSEVLDFIDDNIESFDASIQNAMTETDARQMVNQLIKIVENTYTKYKSIANIYNNAPLSSVEEYIMKYDRFTTELFRQNVMSYKNYYAEFKDNLESIFVSTSGLVNLFSYTSAMMYSVNEEDIDEFNRKLYSGEYFEDFKSQKELSTFFKESNSAMSNVLSTMQTYLVDADENVVKNILRMKGFKYPISNTDGEMYIDSSEEPSRNLFDMMCSTKKWKDIVSERHDALDLNEGISSKNGMTFTMFINPSLGAESVNPDIGILGLDFGLSGDYKLKYKNVEGEYEVTEDAVSMQGICAISVGLTNMTIISPISEDTCSYTVIPYFSAASTALKARLSNNKDNAPIMFAFELTFIEDDDSDTSDKMKYRLYCITVDEEDKVDVLTLVGTGMIDNMISRDISSTSYAEDGIEANTSMKMLFGKHKTLNPDRNNTVNEKVFAGTIKDINMFAGNLTVNELLSIYKKGDNISYYELPEMIARNNIFNLIEQGDFYIGLVNIDNVDRCFVQNCIFDYNMTSYRKTIN